MLKFLYPFLYLITNFYILKCSAFIGQIGISHYVYGLTFSNSTYNKAITGMFND